MEKLPISNLNRAADRIRRSCANCRQACSACVEAVERAASFVKDAAIGTRSTVPIVTKCGYTGYGRIAVHFDNVTANRAVRLLGIRRAASPTVTKVVNSKLSIWAAARWSGSLWHQAEASSILRSMIANLQPFAPWLFNCPNDDSEAAIAWLEDFQEYSVVAAQNSERRDDCLIALTNSWPCNKLPAIDRLAA